MIRWKWWVGLAAVAVAACMAFWPAPRANVSPLLEKHQRPQHPASVYYPPGEPEPKAPGDPGWQRP